MSAPWIFYVIDDDNALRKSVRLFLTDHGYDVRTYASATEFLLKLEAVSLGCVVTDVRMPGMNGMELLSHIAEQGLALPVIIITGHADVPSAVRAMKRGATDFIEKPFRPDQLVEAVRRAIASGRGRGPNEATVQEAQERFATLSDREMEVLDRLIRGQPNKIIAYEMGISPRTVEVHRANVMKKTLAGSLAGLVRMFLNDRSGRPFSRLARQKADERRDGAGAASGQKHTSPKSTKARLRRRPVTADRTLSSPLTKSSFSVRRGFCDDNDCGEFAVEGGDQGESRRRVGLEDENQDE